MKERKRRKKKKKKKKNKLCFMRHSHPPVGWAHHSPYHNESTDCCSCLGECVSVCVSATMLQFIRATCQRRNPIKKRLHVSSFCSLLFSFYFSVLSAPRTLIATKFYCTGRIQSQSTATFAYFFFFENIFSRIKTREPRLLLLPRPTLFFFFFACQGTR